jgi:hypothetical protein
LQHVSHVLDLEATVKSAQEKSLIHELDVCHHRMVEDIAIVRTWGQPRRHRASDGIDDEVLVVGVEREVRPCCALYRADGATCSDECLSSVRMMKATSVERIPRRKGATTTTSSFAVSTTITIVTTITTDTSGGVVVVVILTEIANNGNGGAPGARCRRKQARRGRAIRVPTEHASGVWR